MWELHPVSAKEEEETDATPPKRWLNWRRPDSVRDAYWSQRSQRTDPLMVLP